MQVQVDRRVAQVAGQVDAGEPLRARRHADAAAAHGRAQGVGAVAADVGGMGRVVPRVEPVVVIAALQAAIAALQSRVIALHAGIRLADDDALAGHAQLAPYAVGANGSDVPLRLSRRGQVAGQGRRRLGQGAQVRAVEHAIHFGPGGQVDAHQRSAVHFEGVDQVVRLIDDVQAVEGGTDGRLRSCRSAGPGWYRRNCVAA